MRKYTPTENEMRNAWNEWRWDFTEDHSHEFDRFLAKIKADAWNKGVKRALPEPNERADQHFILGLNPHRKDETNE